MIGTRSALLIIAFFGSLGLARAADFELKSPGSWRQTPTSHTGRLFERVSSKRKQMVLVYVTDLESPSSTTPDDIASAQAAEWIEKTRSSLLDSIGIYDYTLLSIEPRRFANANQAPALQIESVYQGLAGATVQMVERQYFAGDKIYNVVYSEEGAVLANRAQTETWLDQFVPTLPKSRAPAEYRETRRRTNAAATRRPVRAAPLSPPLPPELPPGLRGPAAPAEKFEMRQPNACAHIKDEILKRKPNENDAGFGDQAFDRGMGCLSGGALAIPGAIQKAFQTASGLGSAFSGAYSWATDSKYRAEANASAAAAFEAMKDPGALWNKLVSSSTEYFRKEMVEYDCLSNFGRAQAVCRFIGEFVVSGGIVKVGMTLVTKGASALIAAGGPAAEAARAAARKAMDGLASGATGEAAKRAAGAAGAKLDEAAEALRRAGTNAGEKLRETTENVKRASAERGAAEAQRKAASLEAEAQRRSAAEAQRKAAALEAERLAQAQRAAEAQRRTAALEAERLAAAQAARFGGLNAKSLSRNFQDPANARDVLGVSGSAGAGEIRSAHSSGVRRYVKWKQEAATAAEKQLVEDYLKAINGARDTLAPKPMQPLTR